MRTIREETAISKYFDENTLKYPRLSDVLDGLKWRLARKPESGTNIEKNFYILASSDVFDIPNLPTLVLLYKFDSSTVDIIDARITEAA
jgi:hypothetical protein